MRVLHLAWTFSPLTETFVYDLVRETSRRAEAMVVTRRRVNAEARPFDRVEVVGPRGGVPGKLVDWARSLLSRDPVLVVSWVAVRRGLDRAVRTFRPDVIHAQFGDMGVLAAPVARAHGVPLVTTFHGHDASRELRDRRRRGWFRALTAGRNRVVAVASPLRTALVEAGLDPARIAVVHNGKDLARYPFRARERPPRRFVTAGRLVEKKGHGDAIAALARLAAEGCPLELEVIGDGPLAPALKAQAAALGLKDRVRFLGPLDHAAARARMEQSDAFLLCSRTASCGDREGLPMVLLEAQALGLPCVSTTHSGIPEGIPAENHALLAPEGDVDAIAAALRRLRQATPDELRAISLRGLAHVRAHHDLERQTARLLALYRAAAA